MKWLITKLSLILNVTGKYDQGKTLTRNDMLKGLLAELDETGNTKEVEFRLKNSYDAFIYEGEAQKAILQWQKVNDVLTFNPKTYEGHDAEIASLLKIRKKQQPKLNQTSVSKVEEITRFVEGDLNQGIVWFGFRKDVVTIEEEFRAKVKESIASQFVADSDYKFLLDARKVIEAKVGKVRVSGCFALKESCYWNNTDKGEEFVNEKLR